MMYEPVALTDRSFAVLEIYTGGGGGGSQAVCLPPGRSE